MDEQRDQVRQDSQVPLSGDIAYYQVMVSVPTDPAIDGIIYQNALAQQSEIQRSLDEDAKRLFGEEFAVEVRDVRQGSVTIEVVLSIVGVSYSWA